MKLKKTLSNYNKIDFISLKKIKKLKNKNYKFQLEKNNIK